jgi:hypothetical protein
VGGAGRGGGGWIPPPLGKPHFGVSYTGNNTYIRNSDPNGFFPSIKTLYLVAAENQKFMKEKISRRLFAGLPKIRTLYFFFKMTVMDIHKNWLVSEHTF